MDIETLEQENEALEGALAIARRQLSGMRDVAKALAGRIDLDEILPAILEKVTELTDCDRATLFVVDERRDELWSRVAHGVQPIRISRQTGIAGFVATSGIGLNLPNAYEDKRFNAGVDEKTGYKTTSLLAMPILDADRNVVGVMEALNKKGGPFSVEDERLIEAISAEISVALRNALLFEQLKENTEKLKRAAQLEALGTMLAGIVHDLKTPMTVISGYVQVMAMEESAPERQQAADTILKHCEQMTAMVKDLLHFARGETSVFVRKVALTEFMRDLQDTTARMIGDRERMKLSVTTSYRGAVRMDDVKMKRVLQNLAKNSLEAMPNGGQLTLAVDRVGDVVEFVVQDTGPGLPPEMEQRLFQEFATFGKKDGTGLGLAVAKKIVDEHKGDVRVESKPGHGVTFRVRIPM